MIYRTDTRYICHTKICIIVVHLFVRHISYKYWYYYRTNMVMVSYTNKNDSIENAIRFLLINLDRKFVHKWQFVNWRITWRIDRIFGGEWHFDNMLLRRNNCVLHKTACAILLQKYYGKVCPIMDGIGHFLQIGNGVSATRFVATKAILGTARTWNCPVHSERLALQIDRPSSSAAPARG